MFIMNMADLCDSVLVHNHFSLTVILFVKMKVLDDGIIIMKCIIDCVEWAVEYNKSVAILIVISGLFLTTSYNRLIRVSEISPS